MSIWYPYYPGDHLRDTLDLSLEEDGAYRRMLDHYYTSRCALPVDRFKMARILRVSPQKAERMVDVLRKFFEEKDGLLFHKRVENEIDKILKKHEKAVANGREGGKANAVANAQARRVATTTTPTSINKHNKQMAEKNEIEKKFDLFYSEYPRKEKPKEALKAFIKLNPDDVLLQKILSDINQRKKSPKWLNDNGKYIQNPSNYLNNKGWNDGLNAFSSNKNQGTEWYSTSTGIDAKGKEYGMEIGDDESYPSFRVRIEKEMGLQPNKPEQVERDKPASSKSPEFMQMIRDKGANC